MNFAISNYNLKISQVPEGIRIRALDEIIQNAFECQLSDARFAVENMDLDEFEYYFTQLYKKGGMDIGLGDLEGEVEGNLVFRAKKRAGFQSWKIVLSPVVLSPVIELQKDERDEKDENRRLRARITKLEETIETISSKKISGWIIHEAPSVSINCSVYSLADLTPVNTVPDQEFIAINGSNEQFENAYYNVLRQCAKVLLKSGTYRGTNAGDMLQIVCDEKTTNEEIKKIISEAAARLILTGGTDAYNYNYTISSIDEMSRLCIVYPNQYITPGHTRITFPNIIFDNTIILNEEQREQKFQYKLLIIRNNKVDHIDGFGNSIYFK